MMLTASLKRLAIFATIAALLFTGATARVLARVVDEPGEAGAIITNRVEATYVDGAGNNFSTVSPTITVTVLAVAALAVTPDETEPSATIGPRETVTRLFRVCNTGNTPDNYMITRAEVNAPASLVNLYYDTDASGTVTDADTSIRLNESLSPRMPQGACIGVLAVIATNDFPPQTNFIIQLTARSSVVLPGATVPATDDGAIINIAGVGPQLGAPDNPSLAPIKLVNGESRQTVAPGSVFTYTIAFRNHGDTVARDVLISDDLPAEVEYVAGSLRMGERSLTEAEDADEGFVRERRVAIRLAGIAPNEVVRISFQAHLKSHVAAGAGVVNTATLAGENFPSTQSSTAMVVVDPFGIVYAGRSNGATPIAGARVEILLNQAGDNLLPLPPGVGFPPNLQNDNPFITDAQGRYSFALTPEQLGAADSPARYFMRITAQGYITRLLELVVRPNDAGLYVLTVRALDNQFLARAGSFELVREDVQINDIATIALNIPMFEQHGLGITKSVDRPRVEIGDTITYRIEVHNPTAGALNDVTVRDRLPASFHYVAGTTRLNDSLPEHTVGPEAQGGELIFRIDEIGPGATARILYRVRVGANAREGEQENVAVASGLFSSGERAETVPARATVMVGGGVFSTRQVLLGRVFEDVNRNDVFDAGDHPLPGVRLYLNSGQSVITDSQGLYNFPSLNDGAQVIALDAVTLPAGYALSDGGTLAGRSWTRLLRTPLGGGALLRQNFALISNNKSQDDNPPAPSKVQGDVVGAGLVPARTGQQASDGDSSQPLPNSASASSRASAMWAGTSPAPTSYKASYATPNAAGTYEIISTETIEPIAPGDVHILSPAANAVMMSPAMQLEARVALNWSVRLEVNGEQVSDKSIGTTRLDQKNNVSTFAFVGINLRPGANRVRVTAVSPEGTTGRTEEMAVMGRGPARRVEIVPEKTEIQAGGRDSARLRVRAYDQWNNPAADGQIAINTSAGQLLRVDDKDAEAKAPLPREMQTTATEEQTSASAPSQIIVSLEGGEAVLKLVAPGAPGEAHIAAQMGEAEARAKVRITPELRPTILVGLAEVSIGRAAPEVSMRGEEGNFRSRLSFFYNGRLFGRNILTLAYDSQRPINRTSGRDRLFQLDPLERVYPLFGDSSTRYEAAPSNSKLYARLDRGRSYAMFGDFEANMEDLSLAGYSRKLTGVKAHLENSQGDFITVTGARPDTAFARDVFPGGTLSLVRLSHSEILPGSENIVLEVRDRRNPEIILSRETLLRSIDYNLNPATGELFLLRYISTFDYALNLIQVVATYEHRTEDFTSAVYTARAQKNFKSLGLRLGLSAVVQRQADFGSYVLGGIDGEKSLPHKGMLRFAWARSRGEIAGSGNFFGAGGDGQHDGGNAYQVELEQPLPFYDTVVRARYQSASAGFFNPFGATVTPGSRRGELNIELKPRASSKLRFGLISEHNKTETVDNSRLTLSAAWEQVVNERVRFHLGFDHRKFSDDLNDRTVASNLLTAGAEVRLTDKLQFSIKREQNLGEADPTYPNQTTLSATYEVNNWTKLFFTQRLASAPIVPIGDVAQTGFAVTGSRRETAIGVETRFGKYTSMVGRYQLENGVNSTDSFAVIGLQNRLPLSKELSLELGFERGFHLAGLGQSFNSATLGFNWHPTEDFRASARYEFRDRGGRGRLLAVGAAGRISEGITALSRFQWARGGTGGRSNSSIDGMAAVAFRPLQSDRAGLLFSYTHRSLSQSDGNGLAPSRDRLDSLATDGYYQATKSLELYGRFALRFNGNGQPDLPYVSTLTYLTQARAQYRLTKRFDWAGEMRLLMQASSGTQRSTYGTELGFWALPDLRLGVGYNFTAAGEPDGSRTGPARRGFYFTVSSKLSNLFDLFGTSKQGLAGSEKNQPDNSGEKR